MYNISVKFNHNLYCILLKWCRLSDSLESGLFKSKAYFFPEELDYRLLNMHMY